MKERGHGRRRGREKEKATEKDKEREGKRRRGKCSGLDSMDWKLVVGILQLQLGKAVCLVHRWRESERDGRYRCDGISLYIDDSDNKKQVMSDDRDTEEILARRGSVETAGSRRRSRRDVRSEDDSDNKDFGGTKAELAA